MMIIYKGLPMTKEDHLINVIREYDDELAEVTEKFLKENYYDMDESDYVYSELYDECEEVKKDKEYAERELNEVNDELEKAKKALQERKNMICNLICSIWGLTDLRENLLRKNIEDIKEHIKEMVPDVGKVLDDKENWKGTGKFVWTLN